METSQRSIVLFERVAMYVNNQNCTCTQVVLYLNDLFSFVHVSQALSNICIAVKKHTSSPSKIVRHCYLKKSIVSSASWTEIQNSENVDLFFFLFFFSLSPLSAGLISSCGQAIVSSGYSILNLVFFWFLTLGNTNLQTALCVSRYLSIRRHISLFLKSTIKILAP